MQQQVSDPADDPLTSVGLLPASVERVALGPMVAPAYRFSYHASLDGLRAMAVVLVFMFHAPYHDVFGQGGHIGVDMFLVLSGFLITSILTTEWSRQGTFSLSKFYLRRLLRLTPAVLVCALVVSTIDLHRHQVSWYEVGRYFQALLLYYVNIGPWISLAVPQGLEHCWSLSLEEQFYLVWPWVLLFMLRRSPRTACLGALGLAGLATGWECWLSHHGVANARLYLWLDTRANAALLGAAIGLLPWAVGRDTTERWATALSRYTVAFLGVLVVGFLSLPAPGELRQPDTIPVIVSTAALILIFVFGPDSKVRRWFERPSLVGLGRLSYSFYLWHFPAICYVGMHLFRGNGAAVQFAMALLMTWCAAWLSYHFVETPFLRLKQRFETTKG